MSYFPARAVASSVLLLVGVACNNPSQEGDGGLPYCPESQLVSGIHLNEAGLRRALHRSDQIICSRIQQHAAYIDLVVSFSHGIDSRILELMLDRHPISVFMVDVRSGSSRVQFEVDGHLAAKLRDIERRNTEAVERESQMIAFARTAFPSATSDEELTRLVADLAIARAGPLYVAIGATVPTFAVSSLFSDPLVRYIVAADLMVFPKGIDPMTGEWE